MIVNHDKQFVLTGVNPETPGEGINDRTSRSKLRPGDIFTHIGGMSRSSKRGSSSRSITPLESISPSPLAVTAYPLTSEDEYNDAGMRRERRDSGAGRGSGSSKDAFEVTAFQEDVVAKGGPKKLHLNHGNVQ